MDYADWRFAAPQIEASSAPIPAVPLFSPDDRRKALAAALRSPNYWQRTWEGADTLETRDVDAGPFPSMNGWTACDQARKHCVLILRSNAPDYGCTLEHEKVHAAGFDHPNQTHNMDCATKMPLPNLR